MIQIAMRIGGSNPYAAQAQQIAAAQTPAAQDSERQVAVLKKALDSHQAASEKLLQMLEPKGKVIDIRA